MRINTNTSANAALANLGRVQDAVSKSMEKLSSGFRINHASDDAAGLGIANKLRADGKALTQASHNAEQANSMFAIAEGATNTIQDMLERMKELATQANSTTIDSAGLSRLQAEFSQLRSEITRTVNTTTFQGNKLLDGSFGTTIDTNTANSTALVSGTTGVTSASISGASAASYKLVHTVDNKLTLDNQNGLTQTITVADGTAGGTTYNFDKLGVSITVNSTFKAAAASDTVNGKIIKVNATTAASFQVSSSAQYGSATGDLISVNAFDLTVQNTGSASGTQLELGSLDLTAGASATNGAQDALTKLDTAISSVNTILGNIGAAQNRITYASDNVKTAIQNFSAAESVIRDVDMAAEMTNFSKNQIIAQAGTAMLAQANQLGAGVLKLLQ